ncbi:hypothetical protein [Methylotuvimicrobium alcaliphilum]|uniref:Uncharacterized protein n=1 Tax=Methylotuvimicrobium alcaliphilum (strain DSM 19304 / NCIMB 14124 / VKM B-2133 / 20Z) TaxID=1091494 RepID=G4T2Y3_META2|nr:hypothetical protein [Methylotuvimicrobium alcaliphilum]CCE23636.1 protein of unknown function [Methylotuvimicrobium alcaliphilum 20Z]
MQMSNVNLTNPGISFVTGAPISCDTGLLILSIDELFHDKEPHSLLVVKDHDVTNGILVSSNCCDVILANEGGNLNGYFLGEDGGIWFYNGNTIEASDPITSNKNFGALRSQAFSSNSYHIVAGGGNTAFLKKTTSEWKDQEIKMSQDIEQFKYVGFEKIVALPEGSFYLFGWHGIGILLADNRSTRLDLPTNLDIYDAVLTNDGFIYTCGDQGTILRGCGLNDWSIINNEITGDKLWGICSFEGRTFVCSMNSIYEIVDNELQFIEYSEFSDIPLCQYT